MIRPASATDPVDGPLGYRPDLDGLRAVAVLLVILTHAQLPWANNGGDTGVTAFFVLSGYLITRLLMDEQARTGRVDVVAFYQRRVVRLGPALLILVSAVAIASFVVVWPGAWRLGIVSCLLYISNWVEVLGIQINPLGHTWTLAIEEQFYLLWPAIFLLFARPRLVWLALAAIVVGSLARTVSTSYFEYFSTITRGDAILVGCVLALVGIRLPAWAGAIGVMALVASTYMTDSQDIGIAVAMLASSLVVTSEWRPLGSLAPIGRRAYGLYLWNWPLTLLFGPIAAILTFIPAELSYRLVERPIVRQWRQSRVGTPMTLNPPSTYNTSPVTALDSSEAR